MQKLSAILFVSLFSTAATFVAGCTRPEQVETRQAQEQPQERAPANARQLVKDGAALIDVRTPAEFATAHIEGAVNIPLQELAARTSEVGARDKPVVVYCASGKRSAQAAALLRGEGFTLVHDLGPMSAWPAQ